MPPTPPTPSQIHTHTLTPGSPTDSPVHFYDLYTIVLPLTLYFDNGNVVFNYGPPKKCQTLLDLFMLPDDWLHMLLLFLFLFLVPVWLLLCSFRQWRWSCQVVLTHRNHIFNTMLEDLHVYTDRKHLSGNRCLDYCAKDGYREFQRALGLMLTIPFRQVVCSVYRMEAGIVMPSCGHGQWSETFQYFLS